MAFSDFVTRIRPGVVKTPLTPEPDIIRTPIETSISTGPGKFQKLTDFASLEPLDRYTPHPGEFPLHQSFEKDQLEVSQIVHITHKDANSPFHNRIMLVIRLNNTSLTCLGFCTHKHAIPSQHSAHHAKLITANAEVEEREQDADYFKVCVCLDEGKPAKDVYLDLRDQDTVPRGSDVKFAVLGFADSTTFEDVLWKMFEVSAKSFKLDLQDYPGRAGSVVRVEVPVVVESGMPVMEVAESGRRYQGIRQSIESERGHSKKDKRYREASSEKPGRRSTRGKEKKTTIYQQLTGKKHSPRPY